MSKIMTAKMLANELECGEEAAMNLLLLDGFPSTAIAEGVYVVERSLFESWVRDNAKDRTMITLDALKGLLP